jgi:hypothetical protein
LNTKRTFAATYLATCRVVFAGGEGATAREVLRHKSVEKVVMVDIDKVCDSGTHSCSSCGTLWAANRAMLAGQRALGGSYSSRQAFFRDLQQKQNTY